MNAANDFDEDVQCARCGSSMSYEPCDCCDGEGGYFDDEDGEVDVWHECSQCEGEATFPWCLSSEEFCMTHPLPGRENVSRHKVETFRIPRGVTSGDQS